MGNGIKSSGAPLAVGVNAIEQNTKMRHKLLICVQKCRICFMAEPYSYTQAKAREVKREENRNGHIYVKDCAEYKQY